MPKEVSNGLAKLPKDKQATNTRLGSLIKSTIDIKCSGDFPLVRVTDVRNSDVSIANLWESFQLTKMNKELLTELTKFEETYNNSDKSNESQENLTKNLVKFNWDFGKIPRRPGKDPRKITITLKNIGGVPADWCFKMPNDSAIELDAWVDAGTPTAEQAFEKQILDEKIFKIEPKSGTLPPGGQMDLNISYQFDMAGYIEKLIKLGRPKDDVKDFLKHHLNVFF